MATLIDEEQVAETELQEGETLGNIEEDTPVQDITEPEPAVEEEEAPAEDTPPSKYEGKSHEEMVAILEENKQQVKSPSPVVAVAVVNS